MGRKVFPFECFVYKYDAAGRTEKNKDRKTLYSYSIFILLLTRGIVTSAKCKSRTTVLLVQHPAPWSPWSPCSSLIHLGLQFPECGYTKWTKQDQGGPGVDQGHQQDHGAVWWTRGVQDHLGPLKNIFLMHSVEVFMKPVSSY